MKVRKEVKEAMEVLGIDQCRRGQLKPIGKILKGKDVLLIAPTGFGKSMVYQIPAVCWADRLTLVVEPLVALMHDQVKSLQSRGIRAAYLDSTQSAKEQEKVLHKVRQGSCSVLFVTPERLESHVFQKTVRKVDIALLVVDECHCVLRWGASFRPAYQKIGAFADGCSPRPVMLAMTATCPPEEREELLDALQMQDAICVERSLYRSNLVFLKKRVQSREGAKQVLLQCLKKYGPQRALVFCTTIPCAKAAAEELKKHYPGEVALYCGKEKRDEDRILRGEARIIVATSALSMGLDLPDVELVVHLQMPLSLADYYQMAGRAGRNGETARSVLICCDADYRTNRYLLQSTLEGSSLERALELLDEIKNFCDEDRACMVQSLLGALGEHVKRCRYCTNCQKEKRK